jgi:PRC-barrel domain protein
MTDSPPTSPALSASRSTGKRLADEICPRTASSREGAREAHEREKEISMFEAGDTRELHGHIVTDPEGNKIGELESVYIDPGTDLPSFATVRLGRPSRHRLVFVPLNQATVGLGYLQVRYDRKLVRDAPSIGTDGEFPAADEKAIFTHYGLAYHPGTDGARQLVRR